MQRAEQCIFSTSRRRDCTVTTWKSFYRYCRSGTGGRRRRRHRRGYGNAGRSGGKSLELYGKIPETAPGKGQDLAEYIVFSHAYYPYAGGIYQDRNHISRAPFGNKADGETHDKRASAFRIRDHHGDRGSCVHADAGYRGAFGLRTG